MGRIAAVVAAGATLGALLTGAAGLGKGHTDLAARAGRDARAFLEAYERPDGRVVRRDQGRDTVSEGQAYAMLLAVAVGDRPRFAAAWTWSSTHLVRPDGLLAWHWRNGRVLDQQPAADADLLAAWALALAGRRFGRPAYSMAAARLATAIIAKETVVVRGRRIVVAGPWALGPPPVVNPSYLVPQAAAELARSVAGWAEVATGDRAALAGLLTEPAHLGLPPDWATAAADATLSAAGDPNARSSPARYGLDAQRLPVFLSSSCDARDVGLAARWWPTMARLRRHGAATAYHLDGARASPHVSPVGLVAAAATAGAADRDGRGRALLDEAGEVVQRHPTYYGRAWVALGRVLLTTRWLGSCPSISG